MIVIKNRIKQDTVILKDVLDSLVNLVENGLIPLSLLKLMNENLKRSKEERIRF